MASTSDKLEPKYIEGWPRINLIVAFAALRRKRPLCLFRLGRGVIGQCILPERKSDQVLLAIVIGAREIPYAEEEAWLPIVPVPNRLDPSRHNFLCPGCGLRVATLAWNRHWACRTCHGFAYRRQLIPKDVIAAEAMQAIENEIGQGRPAGMHQSTYRKRLGEHDKQQSRAPGFIPPEASLFHKRIISPDWVGLDEFQGLWFRGFTARNGKIERIADEWDD